MEKKNLDFDCFEKFIGHNVFIQNKNVDATYFYKNLSIDYHTYDQLILIDNDNKCKTWIPLDNIESISNLSDDLYVDVITIETTHYEWKIGCAEEVFRYPRCYKCGKEILIPEETMWNIIGTSNYGSYYDDPEENMIVNSLSFCDECVHEFMGEVGNMIN